jgi:large subunit ribosomal protein L25
VLEVFRESIEVSCLPDDIPHEISLDVSDLEIGDNINIDELTLPAGVTPIFDEEEKFAIVGVNHYVEQEIEPETEEEETEVIGEEEEGEGEGSEEESSEE